MSTPRWPPAASLDPSCSPGTNAPGKPSRSSRTLREPTEHRFSDPAQLFPGRILVVAPHMDDEVLACGGTVAGLPHKDRIHVAYATDGARAYSPVVPWLDATSPALSSVRRAEATEALGILGVSQTHI